MSAATAELLSFESHEPIAQGSVVRAKTIAGAKVYLGDRLVQVSDNGDFIFGLAADEPEQIQITIDTPDGRQLERQLAVVQRTYEVQHIDGLAPDKVNPPPQVYERIAREAEMIRQIRQVYSEHLDAFDEFVWPVEGIITGVYGSRRILNGQPRSPHYGVDIACPQGTEIRSPAGGMVRMIEDMYFSGITMVIDHGYGLSSTFLHLSKARVALNERVEQGQIIAEVGATGRVTGPHLDWRINWFERRLDPQSIAQP